MEFKKMNDGSFVHNCYLERRKDDKAHVLFHQDDGETITAFLNGYAIIPLEKYFELTGGNELYNSLLHNQPEQKEEKKRQNEMIRAIKEADEQLYT